jgi:acetate kinase
MKIFILNRGSSSIKCYLYHLTHLPESLTPALWHAQISWKESLEEFDLEISNAQGSHHTETLRGKSIVESLKCMMYYLIQ